MKRLVAAALAIALIWAPTVLAAPSTNLAPRVDALEAQVADLQARVTALEAGATSTPAPTAAPTSPPTAAPTPTAVATPTPAGGSVVRFSGSQAAFVTLTRDMTVDVIDLTGQTFGWEKVLVDVDRTARPLTILGGRFTGNGATSEGIFLFGSKATAKWITMAGQTFDGIALAQAGVLGVWSSDHLTIVDQVFRNLRRDPSWAPSAKLSWAAYIADGNDVRPNANLLIDRWDLGPPAVHRDVSGIQIDSSNLTNGAITIRHVAMSGYAYAFYENVATSPLTLDAWAITDTGWLGVAVSFHKAIGTYRGIDLSGSGTLNVNSSGMVPG